MPCAQVGAVGLGLNIISALVVHDHGEHGRSHGHGHTHNHGSGANTPATTVNDAESGKNSAIPMVRLSSLVGPVSVRQHKNTLICCELLGNVPTACAA